MDLRQDIERTASAAIAGAVEQADAISVSEHEAARAAARGDLAAAREKDPALVRELRGTLLDSLIAVYETEGDRRESDDG